MTEARLPGRVGKASALSLGVFASLASWRPEHIPMARNLPPPSRVLFIVNARTFSIGLAGIASLFWAATLVAAPATQPVATPTTRPAAAPATRPAMSPQDQRRVASLTRRAIGFLEKGDLDAAEPVLAEALKLDPRNITNIYNYACLNALRKRHDQAMDLLELAATAGWSDFTHMDLDPDLAALRELPRYKALVAKKDFYQRRAADRAVAGLKAQFGDGYKYVIDEKTKMIFATNVDQTTLDSLRQNLIAQAHSQWEDLFAHRPDHYITVVVPSEEDYRKVVRMPGVGGFYNDDAKILIARHLGQVMTHEFTHALHAGDKAPLGQEHPIWIHEGLASLYEAATFDENNRLVPADNFRLAFLKNAAAGGKLIPLQKLLDMEQPEFVRRANLAYGQAGSVMMYLYDLGLLRKFYETYKATYAEDSSGALALTKVSGKSVEAFEQAWGAWMRKRTPPATGTGRDGAILGARLEAVNDGLKVTVLLPEGPAARAGMKLGDVLVGIDDREVRDHETFGPTMVAYKPGQEATLKIRRNGEYLNIPITLGKRSAFPEEPEMLRPSTRPVRR